MFKNIFNDLKLNRISYLLEIIETQNFKAKVDAYNKLRKIKINEEAGHLIIDKVMSLKHNVVNNFNVDISLLSLLFNNYYDSYSEHLFEAFKSLHDDTKLELLNILSNSKEPSELILYRTLIYTYYKDLKTYPIGIIALDKDNYELVFPELYETFKTVNNRNSVILLLNDFINLGIVPLYHLKKYKKVLQKQVISILKEGIKYKINPKENFMGDKDYIDLRIFVEAAINIEYYVTNKETNTYIDKLFKTKDNQLKLFILENYARKGKNLSKININSIAKDNLSRYPLYSFLIYNNSEQLMPKKYRNNKDLSLSDLYLNYCISNSYTKIPYDFKLLEERVVEDHKYYIYQFKTEFNYNEEIDPATDYILKNIKVDNELINNGESTYIGISGGYPVNIDPSLIDKNLSSIKIAKLDGDLETLINNLLSDIPPKIEKKVETPKPISDEEKKPSKLARIFSFSKILGFFSIATILLFVVLILYVCNIDLFNLRKYSLTKSNILKAVLLEPKDLFQEIKFNEIYSREENEYYVLFFKKKNKSKYYEYLNTILKNNYKFYFVDISKEENKPIFEGNETGFIIKDDTLLKVSNHDYSFYIIGNDNIIKELKSYVDEIRATEEEVRKEEEKEKKERESIDVDEMLKEQEESTEETVNES